MKNKLLLIRKTIVEICLEYYEEIEIAKEAGKKTEVNKNIAKICGAYQGLANFCSEVNIHLINDIILKCGFHEFCPDLFDYLDSDIDSDLETEENTKQQLLATWNQA